MQKIFYVYLIGIVIGLTSAIYLSPTAESQMEPPNQEIINLLSDILVEITEFNNKASLILHSLTTIEEIEKGDFNSFQINEISERFFVIFVHPTNNPCSVFDKARQTNADIPCFEPYLSLSETERLTYNANYTLP